METEVRAYVLNMHGRPLMPCSPAKARHLLKDQKAKVVKSNPFTIRLLYGSSGYKQPIVLGVDAGSKTVGLSATTDKQELFAAEVPLRNDVVKNKSTSRQFRCSRRSRKTRHREPRFDNRIASKPKGWLAPSGEVKIQEHITPIQRVRAILPVSKVVVETGEFNLQRIKAIEAGKSVPKGEDYQQGEMFGSYNLRQYLLSKFGYACGNCGAHGEGVVLQIHHKQSRKIGGNAPDNLIVLCAKCHKAVHDGIISLGQKGKRKKSTRDATFMNTMRGTLLKRLQSVLSVPVVETKGYITKATREHLLKLPKSHVNDALAIALGQDGFGFVPKDYGSARKQLEQSSLVSKKQASSESLTTESCEEPKSVIETTAAAFSSFTLAGIEFTFNPVRHHNRQLHKATILKGGIRKSNQAAKYVKGFRLYDKVFYEGEEYFIWGRRNSGYFRLKKLDGSKSKDGVCWKKLTLLERSSNYLMASKVRKTSSK